MPRYKIVVVDSEKYAKRFPNSDSTIGAIHTEMASECPLGISNCRNCGDSTIPCAGEGHCSGCGIMHGIAPDSVLMTNGLRLVEAA